MDASLYDAFDYEYVGSTGGGKCLQEYEHQWLVTFAAYIIGKCVCAR